MSNTIGSKIRIESIDVLRGIIMIIMALDHTRDYFHESAILQDPTNLSTTTAPLFFTRWITHYCAPVFMFLAGISAYLFGQHKRIGQLSKYLLSRGLWLVVFEIVVMSFIMTFNPTYNLILLTILWAIGWSMVVLSLLVHTGTKGVLLIGLVLIFGHNVFDLFESTRGGNGNVLLQLLVTNRGTAIPLLPNHLLLIGYAILPWTGVMAIGYALGSLFRGSVDLVYRKKLLTRIGLAATLLFIVLRIVGIYGDPNPFEQQGTAIKSVISFFNVTKYPPSLQFICMTIGPAMIVLAYLENIKNGITKFFLVYGKVPFFYFALHFLTIHLLETIIFFASGHSISQAVDPASPFVFRPSNFGFGLPVTYLMWITVVLLMYYPCRWFGKYKQTHQKWWLSYL
jgi:uncharacterized membrane protein